MSDKLSDEDLDFIFSAFTDGDVNLARKQRLEREEKHQEEQQIADCISELLNQPHQTIVDSMVKKLK